MKKTYIAPVSLEHKIEPVNLIAESLTMYSEEEVDGDQALSNTDFGFQDDDNDACGSWKW